MGVHVGFKLYHGTSVETRVRMKLNLSLGDHQDGSDSRKNQKNDLHKVSPWVSTLVRTSSVGAAVYLSEPCSELPLGDGVPMGVHVGSKLHHGKSVETRVRMKVGLPLGAHHDGSNYRKNQKNVLHKVSP
jgi:hypothetical protein